MSQTRETPAKWAFRGAWPRRSMDGLGQSEGWLVVADPNVAKPWDGKISTEDLTFGAKTVHLVRC